MLAPVKAVEEVGLNRQPSNKNRIQIRPKRLMSPPTSLSPASTSAGPNAGAWKSFKDSEFTSASSGIGADLVLNEVRVGPFCRQAMSFHAQLWNLRARRAVNVLAAVALIVLSAPLMIAAAIAVRLSSPGPILFTQPRVGLDRRNGSRRGIDDPRRREDLGGRVFQIYKFRTMVNESPERRREVWASEDDPRITPVGRILRKFRLDELPQLFNVLKGDMNLVGPRPEQPGIFQNLRTEISGYQDRQRVLPGITGLAQVNQKYDQCLDDVRRKVEFDLTYVEEQSPLKDVKIMAQTIPVVLFGKGSI